MKEDERILDLACGFGRHATRLYTIEEIRKIMQERNMVIEEAFCDYSGNMASPLGFQMIVHSRYS